MRTVIKWLVVIVAAIGVVASIAVVTGIDRGWVKNYAINRVSAALGRELSIRDVSLVDLSLTPRIRLAQIELENAAWSDEPYMLQVRRLAFGIDLIALLKGRIALTDIRIEQPSLHLSVSADGKPNWGFLTGQSRAGKPSLTLFADWRIDKGRVTYHDSRSNLTHKGAVASAQGMIDSRRRRVSLRGNGQLKGQRWRLAADFSGSVADNDRHQSAKVHARLTLGDTLAKVDGSVAPPLDFDNFALDFTLKGRNPAVLNPIAPVSLPHLPPYRAQGRLRRNGDAWSINNLVGNVGLSDVSGDLSLKTGGERMWLRADLVSEKLDFVQISGPAEAGGNGPVFSDAAIDVSPLRVLDARIRYQAGRLYMPGSTFDDIYTELLLKRGHLTLNPLKFDNLGGTFDSHIDVVANARPVRTSLKVELQHLSLNEILATFGLANQATGIISGRIDLDGRGRSAAEFAGSANGSFSLIMKNGRLNALLVEKAGLDVFESLALMRDEEPDAAVSGCTIAGPWCTGENEPHEQPKQDKRKRLESVRIRCLIADFKTQDGVMTAQPLIIDTPDTKVVGSGAIALGSETVDLKLLPRAKDFSVLAGQAPLHIKGSFSGLNVNVSKTRVIASLLTPIELGTADNANCQQLIRAVRQE